MRYNRPVDSDEKSEKDERSADRERRAKDRAARAAERQKRRFGLEDETGEEVGLPERVAMMLASCATRASAQPDPHLARVTLTLGVLSAVRFHFLALKEKVTLSQKGALLDHPKAIAVVNTQADALAKRVLDLVRPKILALEIPHAEAFFGPAFGLPPLRTDLRFMKPLGTKGRIPFGPDFPRFDIRDIDNEIVIDMSNDVVELSFKNVPPPSGSDAERFLSGLENFANFATMLAILGKCVLADWKLMARSVLEQLACMMADRDLEQNRPAATSKDDEDDEP